MMQQELDVESWMQDQGSVDGGGGGRQGFLQEGHQWSLES